MRETYTKLGIAQDEAKKHSTKKDGPIMVKMVKVVGVYVVEEVTDMESIPLDRDEDLVCTYHHGIKSIWPETHVAKFREKAVCPH